MDKRWAIGIYILVAIVIGSSIYAAWGVAELASPGSGHIGAAIGISVCLAVVAYDLLRE